MFASNDVNGKDTTDGANNSGVFMVPEKHFVAAETWARGLSWGLGRIPSFADIPKPLKSLPVFPISFIGTNLNEPKTRSPFALVIHTRFTNPTFTDLLNMS